MLFLGDHCPDCGGSLRDSGLGHEWTCRVCETRWVTDGDSVVVERIPAPEADESAGNAGRDDEAGRGAHAPAVSEAQAAALLGELFAAM